MRNLNEVDKHACATTTRHRSASYRNEASRAQQSRSCDIDNIATSGFAHLRWCCPAWSSYSLTHSEHIDRFVWRDSLFVVSEFEGTGRSARRVDVTSVVTRLPHGSLGRRTNPSSIYADRVSDVRNFNGGAPPLVSPRAVLRTRKYRAQRGWLALIADRAAVRAPPPGCSLHSLANPCMREPASVKTSASASPLWVQFQHNSVVSSCAHKIIFGGSPGSPITSSGICFSSHVHGRQRGPLLS